jgi:hypothetical protein
MRSRHALGLTAALAALGGCATAPRGPAGTLADAGRQATGAISADSRAFSERLVYADVTDAFVETWAICANPNVAVTCRIEEVPEGLSQGRQRLAAVVARRTRAAEALREAYAALQTEAEYDARADLQSATADAVSGVSAFAGAVGLAVPASTASLFAAGTDFLSGVVAERRQRSRLLRANQLIGAATQLFRDSFAREKGIFQATVPALVGKRTDAVDVLLDAGLISYADVLSGMARQLDVKLVSNADAIISKSEDARMATRAAAKAMARADVRTLQARYDASLAALDALLAAHAELGADRPISIADVARTLADLDAVLVKHLDDKED